MRHSLQTAAALLFGWQSIAAAQESDDPIVLHAEGLLAELDGNGAAALAYFRKAQTLSLGDETIAFDLARLSYESKSPMLASDSAAFLSLRSSTPDSHLLRAYLLLAQGERDGAAEQAAIVLQLRPGDDEALKLQALLGDGGRGVALSFDGRIRMGAQYDTNIAVLPEDNPSRLRGTRGLLDALLVLSLEPQHRRLDLGAYITAGPHLTDRGSLSYYDALSGIGFVDFESHHDDFAFNLGVAGGATLIDSFQAIFLQEGGLHAGTRWSIGDLQPGFYAEAGYRDFIFENPEGEAGDRDQPYGEGGVVVDWQLGALWLNLRAGAQQEWAEGESQDERGGLAALNLTYTPAPAVTVTAGMSYEYRDYYRADRLDHRYNPSVSATFYFLEHLGLRLAYSYTRSDSQNLYDYKRHLAHGALVTRW